MIFDSHIKVGVNYKGEDHSIDDYMELMSQNNIEGALICPHKPISYRVADGNDYREIISFVRHVLCGESKSWRNA